MIAEQTIREALGAPTPLERAQEQARESFAACVARMNAATGRRDSRAIHAAQKALTAAKAELLRVGA